MEAVGDGVLGSGATAVADLPEKLWQRQLALMLTSKKMPYLFSIKVEKRM